VQRVVVQCVQVQSGIPIALSHAHEFPRRSTSSTRMASCQWASLEEGDSSSTMSRYTS
jgi:hypothetical protein